MVRLDVHGSHAAKGRVCSSAGDTAADSSGKLGWLLAVDVAGYMSSTTWGALINGCVPLHSISINAVGCCVVAGRTGLQSTSKVCLCRVAWWATIRALVGCNPH